MNITIFYRLYVAKKSQEIFPNRQFPIQNVTSFQNACKMSTPSPLSEIRLCPFDPAFNTSSHYICYKYEKCCRQGCCSTYGLTYYQSWYFWGIVLLIMLIFYLGSWYCKKIELERKRRLQTTHNPNTSSPSSLNSSPRVSPRRRPTEDNVDHLLDYLIHSYRLQTVNETRTTASRQGGNLEPPPKYQEALSMPKLVRNNVQVVQIHASGDNSMSTQPQSIQNTEVNIEALPTYEDAVESSTKGTDNK